MAESNQATSDVALPTQTLPDQTEKYESYDVVYEFTATTFKKTSRLPHTVQRPDGSAFEWYRPWNHERITNEANALQLVSQKTTIPVPRLISTGVHADGTRYLITERIDGISLSELLNSGCPLPEEEKHIAEQQCETCVQKANSNALEFIEHTVLPQLANLKSHERGILGFVMPPSWLSDAFPPWTGKGPWKTHRLEEAKYVFQHGDLAGQNILLDRKTLQIKALIDWEHAGFFPLGMERWQGTLDQQVYNRQGYNLAGPIAKYLVEEYLECYNAWEDKAKLALSIENGELPNPEQLRLRM